LSFINLLKLRGFAPIGIMEYWNGGMMGLKVSYQFYKKISSSFIANNSSFHHSITPSGIATWGSDYISIVSIILE